MLFCGMIIVYIEGLTYKKGKEAKYGSAYKMVYKYKGKVVEVTFRKLSGGEIRLSNAWVK